MARDPLAVDQYNAATQAALRELNELLPNGLHTVGSEGHDLWVAYPDSTDEAKVREEIQAALATLDERGMRGVSIA